MENNKSVRARYRGVTYTEVTPSGSGFPSLLQQDETERRDEKKGETTEVQDGQRDRRTDSRGNREKENTG